MIRYLIVRLFLATGLAGLATQAYADADEVFRIVGPSVIQIRILDQGTGSRSSAGTGFLAGGNGTVISNYHVVSRLVTHPDAYRAEYRLDNGSSGELRLVAVDAINDLAVLEARFEGEIPDPLQLDSGEMAKGQRLYSLGNPFDIGLTIVDGIFNGFLEHTYQRRMHFTGTLNPGMSGGPVVNPAGRVVGVNVAGGSNVGFLVPATEVQTLLLSAESFGDGTFSDQISVQLLEHQDRYMRELLDTPFPTIPIGDFTVPGALAPWIECSGDTDHDENNRGIVVTMQNCDGSHNLYLDRNQATGKVSISHQLFKTDSLHPERFYRFLERRFRLHGNRYFGSHNDAWLTGYECRSHRIRQDDENMKAALCLRAYRPIAGLYDLHLKVASLNSNRQALFSTASITGISMENARAFSQAYLEAISWKQ